MRTIKKMLVPTIATFLLSLAFAATAAGAPIDPECRQSCNQAWGTACRTACSAAAGPARRYCRRACNVGRKCCLQTICQLKQIPRCVPFRTANELAPDAAAE